MLNCHSQTRYQILHCCLYYVGKISVFAKKILLTVPLSYLLLLRLQPTPPELVLHFVIREVSQHAQLKSDLLFGQLTVLLVDLLDNGLPALLNLTHWHIHIRLLHLSALILLAALAIRCLIVMLML